VMTIHPDSVIRFPKVRAWAAMLWSAGVRAEPKTVTLGTPR
jgi:hypothetical protein